MKCGSLISYIYSGPGLIPGSWLMMRHVSCILFLEWSTTAQRLWVYRISVPYAQKDPRFLFEKEKGQPREFWSLVSTIGDSTLPQDCVEEVLCRTRSNWLNIQFISSFLLYTFEHVSTSLRPNPIQSKNSIQKSIQIKT